MERKFLTFSLSPEQLKYKKILSKDFLELDVYAVSDIDPNRNETHFTLSSMQKALPTFKNKPILGYFERGDFVEHNGRNEKDREYEKIYWNNDNGERILGFIRESDVVEIVQRDGLNWIHLTCVLCIRYCYKQAKRMLLDRTKKVSVEVQITDSYVRDDGIEEINDFILGGITILGSKNGKPILEGIPNAEATCMALQLDDAALQGQKQVLCYAYQEMDKAMAAHKNNNKEECTVDDKQFVTGGEGEATEEACKNSAPAEGEETNCNSSDCGDGEAECKNDAEGDGCAMSAEDAEGACLSAEPCSTDDNCKNCDNTNAADGEENCNNSADNCGCEDKEQELNECKNQLAACEEKLSESEKKLCDMTAKLSECEEKLKACEDYEDIKMKLQAAEAKLFSIHCNELRKAADEMMKAGTVSEEDRELIAKKCSEGKYASNEELERDVAYAIYKARPAKAPVSEAFSVDIVIPENTKNSVSAKSRKEKIADYAHCKN